MPIDAKHEDLQSLRIDRTDRGMNNGEPPAWARRYIVIGVAIVAVLTQFVFRDPLALRYSISIVATIAGLLACVAIGISLRNFPALMSSYAVPPDAAGVSAA